MNSLSKNLKIVILALLLLASILMLLPQLVQAAPTNCVVPERGPWPPCATGGGLSTGEDNSSVPNCVIPPRGPWPPCATGGD